MIASSVTDIAYIIEDEMSKKAARRAVGLCIRTVDILAVDVQRITDAFELNGIDFEDDLQIVTASHFRLDGIVTRDKTGFAKSSVQVYTPTQFVEQLQRQRTKKNE